MPTDRVRNKRKLGNIYRLTARIKQHFADVGSQYEEAQPAIAEGCLAGVQFVEQLDSLVESLIKTL